MNQMKPSGVGDSRSDLFGGKRTFNNQETIYLYRKHKISFETSQMNKNTSIILNYGMIRYYYR